MVDWKTVLGYNTVKIVTIRDPRLGLLHYGFMVAVVVYILVYTILLEKKYLVTERPIGSIRLSLLKGKVPTPIDSLLYCKDANHSSVPVGEATFPCMYQDELFVVYPTTEATAMLATTRYVYMQQALYCDLQDPSFVADIEQFTLLIDHTVYAPVVGIQKNAKALTGSMSYSNGTEMILPGPPDNVIGVSGYNDVIELGTLLKAAEINSLDEFKSVQANLINSTFREVYNRHGIRMIFVQDGLLGKFDFQVTLLTFVSGLGLLTVSTVVVDMIAIYILPQKKQYEDYKYTREDGAKVGCFGGRSSSSSSSSSSYPVNEHTPLTKPV